MDLAIVLDGWSFDEEEEANNIRKIVGVDGRLKLQIRLRDGVIQWELEGRPDGKSPYGCESVLEYCLGLMEEQERREGTAGFLLERQELLEQLEAELLSYDKRRAALFRISDYARSLQDALHGLGIIELVRRYAGEGVALFQFDRHRPRLTADRARSEALLMVQRMQLDRAVQALNDGIQAVEEFLAEYGLEDESGKSRERNMLIDLRRSLRERYRIPITDDELLQSLKTEQQVAIQQEDFEMAARLRDKINLLLAKLNGTS
jgi:hypothetical protein